MFLVQLLYYIIMITIMYEKKVKINLDNWKIILIFVSRNKKQNDYENFK